MLVGEDERRVVTQDAVDLAEEAREVVDLADRVGAERDVDRVGAEEREVGEVAAVPLDPHLGACRALARDLDLVGGRVDRDDGRALTGERDRGLARSAPEVEHPLAAHVTEQAELALGRERGTVVHGVGRRTVARPLPPCDPIPGLSIGHVWIVPLAGRWPTRRAPPLAPHVTSARRSPHGRGRG